MSEIPAEVAIAWPEQAFRVQVKVTAGATLMEAVRAAAACSESFAEALGRLQQESPAALALGVFGQPREGSAPLSAGDRVEVYRPLRRDPRDARRLLASQGLNVTQSG